MDKEFIPHQESLELVGLGYDEPVEFFKDSLEEIFDMRTPNDAPCILWQQAFRFFREKGYDIIFRKMDYGVESNFTGYYYTIYNGNEMIEVHGADKRTKTYEEAELACLKKLIEIVKN